MKVVTIVGARPQFIKAAPLSRALRRAGVQEYLLHTGQHYDYGMSQVFFEELGLPEADINLNVRSGGHGEQTGQMLIAIETVLLQQKPDAVIVFGDTNSTLAGALAAVKLHIPLAHIEAGLRSFNRRMPEEHNRVLTDHCADLLFCPTQTAVENLHREGLTAGVHLVGDPMYDAVLLFGQRAEQKSHILESLGLRPGAYLLATIHRAYNTDDPQALATLLDILQSLEETVILPVHPRTRRRIAEFGLLKERAASRLRLIEPLSYLDMLVMEKNARLILTDSGGVQKEAYFFAVPCLTLRPETEWVETLTDGWNTVVGLDADLIRRHVREASPPATPPRPVFGEGNAAEKIVEILTANARR
ncbi:MAG: UDP-N-acetylglucosamine 2-epimerase (non-hydrolyzing) [Anaerolineales bacterium]|nr:UDP-N-acetylglucosamine 2-epimerase (non-hydrolyzing) [Anaerolineales bacterium]MCX7754938.1 UDP-N-acetylglucosamine 2-epimerase (non-hydrolyzing) [Anaerolineales bacterium]MDW8277315.1 UDP-N-acetylglucosamine 2-epimerase (non-hydrolyzing) [Anaerolineales bacterium]